MARIKIILKNGETREEVEEQLLKALNLHKSGDIHDSEKFEDPAMDDLENKIAKLHELMFQEMLNEVVAEIDREYSDGNF